MLDIFDPPRCRCHAEPMSRNGRQPNGTPTWRCAVTSRARMAAARTANPRPAAPARVPMTADEWLASVRHSKAQHVFNKHARSRAEVYAKRAAQHGTDGEAIIPLRYLWYPVPALVELVERAYGTDLPAELRRHGLGDVWEHTVKREHVNFAKADRMLTRLGLYTWQLPDPLFSVGVPAREVVAA